MGSSDRVIHPQQKEFVNLLIEKNYLLNENQQICKIAHLGNSYVNIVVAHYKRLFPEAQHDLYDIVLKNWDINKDWGIENYDIVVLSSYNSLCRGL